jgi:hypothetical protein
MPGDSPELMRVTLKLNGVEGVVTVEPQAVLPTPCASNCGSRGRKKAAITGNAAPARCW